jgi:hypothetical protein
MFDNSVFSECEIGDGHRLGFGLSHSLIASVLFFKITARDGQESNIGDGHRLGFGLSLSHTKNSLFQCCVHIL